MSMLIIKIWLNHTDTFQHLGIIMNYYYDPLKKTLKVD